MRFHFGGLRAATGLWTYSAKMASGGGGGERKNATNVVVDVEALPTSQDRYF